MTITGEMTITPEQVKAARELLGWTLVRLAARADASELAVRRYESGRGIGGRIDLTSIREMLEAAGVEFTNGGQPGVRMSRSVSTVEFEVTVGEDHEPVLKGHDGNNVPVIATLSRASFEASPIQAERVKEARRSRSVLNEIA